MFSSGQVDQGNTLECHMRLTTLVEDADGLVVNHQHARIAGSGTFIQKQAMLLRPRQTAIGRRLDRNMIPPARAVGIGKQQPAANVLLNFLIDIDKTRHT